MNWDRRMTCFFFFFFLFCEEEKKGAMRREKLPPIASMNSMKLEYEKVGRYVEDFMRTHTQKSSHQCTSWFCLI